MNASLEEAASERRLSYSMLIGNVITRTFTVLALLLAINFAFNLRLLVGYTLLENQYLYCLLGLTLPVAFIQFRHRAGVPENRVPWFDWLLIAVLLFVIGYFVVHSFRIVSGGWEMAPPDAAIVAGVVLWLIVIEAGRRAGGAVLAVIVAVISAYPIYADILPGPISAFASPFDLTAAYHAMSGESILGIPMQAFGGLIVGFILFGAALQHTGAGAFFINLAFGLLGHVRGGPAKVAIVSSALMGSMSGSVVTNVMTTGVMTIPAMRRTGMSRTFAGAVETCASTGGVLMPPVMGATAFVMSDLLGVPYATIALAAVLPSFLYFFGLFIQIDSRAARESAPGLDLSELPSLRETFARGWYYVFAFGLLVFMLLVLKRESLAPYYATAALIFLNQIGSRDTRWGMKELTAFIDSLARLFANLVAILAAVGLIVGALSFTGLAGTLVNDLLRIGGDSVVLLLLMGALTSLVLGVGMPVTAAYIFLAILLAPALIQSGLNPLAVHLFVFYWGMLSFITPPVALGAFAAASIAGAPPMKTGFEAMRLGSVIYFIPFFFVFEPALILDGSFYETAQALILALIGIFIFASAMQGYMVGIGNLFTEYKAGVIARAIMVIGSLSFAFPGNAFPGWNDQELFALGTAIIAPLVLGAYALNSRQKRQG